METPKKFNAETDPFRPGYHIAPLQGWINDPNGLVFFKGQYHVFFQYYPDKPTWGPCHWGHVVSDDMIHWRYLPNAISPDQEYDSHETEGGCYSGSAIEHEGRLYLLYTGCCKDRAVFQSQCLAVSEDGINFTKYEGNPVIPCPPEDGSRDFRDPKVWWANGAFHVVIGSEKNGIGQVLMYSSPDLKSWEYRGVMAKSDGTEGAMWECPDLAVLPDGDLLVYSPCNAQDGSTRYLFGRLDYTNGVFDRRSTGIIDRGTDFYAPQTMQVPDGRRVLIGWLSSWTGMHPTRAHGWAGQLSVPRELTVSPEGKLRQTPVKELDALRTEETKMDLSGTEGTRFLDIEAGVMFELLLTVNGQIPSVFGFLLRCSQDHSAYTTVTVRTKEGRVEINREHSGPGDQFGCDAPIQAEEDGGYQLRIFSDRSSLELFTSRYETTMSCNIYPSPENGGIAYFAEEAAGSEVKLTLWKQAEM